MKRRRIDEEIELGIGMLVLYIIKFLYKLLKNSFSGIKDIIRTRSLNKIAFLIGTVILILVFNDILNKYVQIEVILIFVPIFEIALIGYFSDKKEQKAELERERYLDNLRNIFGSKAEIYAIDCGVEDDNLYEIFKTNIPISVWRSKEEQLKHLLKVEHIDISYTKNMRYIKVVCFMNKPKDKKFELEKLFNSTMKIINTEEDDIKQVETFNTDIHLDAWKSKLSRIRHIYNSTATEVSYVNGSNIRLINYKTEVPKYTEWKDEYIDTEEKITLGTSLQKGNLKIDFNSTPHLIVAGETGGGKSVLISSIIIQLLVMVKKMNSKIDIIISDFKGGIDFIHFSPYMGIITELEKFDKFLDEIVAENERRIKLLLAHKCKNIKEYNSKFDKKLVRKILVIDEISVVTDRTGASQKNKEIMQSIEGKLSDLARRSRATGINLIIGVQIPNYKILPGQIKNNCPGRICGRFADDSASQIVLGSNAASNLPAIKGRMIYKSGLDIVEFQGFFVNPEKEIERLFPEDNKSKDKILDKNNIEDLDLIKDPEKISNEKNKIDSDWSIEVPDIKKEKSESLTFSKNDLKR